MTVAKALPQISEFQKSGDRSRSRESRFSFAYRFCERMTEVLLYFMVVFTPWAFGTTEQWSVWTMNITAYCIGVMLAGKWAIRWRLEVRSTAPVEVAKAIEREEMTNDSMEAEERGKHENREKAKNPIAQLPNQRVTINTAVSCTTERVGALAIRLLAGLTGFFLLYVLVSAVNARAVFDEAANQFIYFEPVDWLPHSYDANSTWHVFWQYLGLAVVFWATRDWLLERHMARDRNSQTRGSERDLDLDTRIPNSPMPKRLNRLLWVLCLSGTLLALEGILQRLDGTDKLLWLVQPRINNTASAQFGPYAYRSNAATYLNLIWPVCLGFFLVLRRTGNQRIGGGNYMVLLPCAVLMAAAPIISTSRGGALVTFGCLGLSMAAVYLLTKKETRTVRVVVGGVILGSLVLGGMLGWKQLEGRLKLVSVDKLSNRLVIYENAQAILHDHPFFGTGAGTFGNVYQSFRRPGEVWAAYAHDDWLETRATVGWIGLFSLLAMFLITTGKPFIGSGIPAAPEFILFIGISITGFLVHSKFDFPFQIYSTLLLFLVLCSVLVSIRPIAVKDPRTVPGTA